MHSVLFLPARFQLAVTVLLAIVPFISATSSPSKPSRGELESVNQQRDAGSLPAGWALKSCMTDDPNQPTLTAGGSFTNKGMTVEFCVNICQTAYLTYAGLENGNQCSCGNVTTPGATISQNCKSNCVGIPTETCGGPNAISLYGNGVSQPNPIVVTTVGPWSLQGCYSDSKTSRTLPNPASISGVTIENCLDACTNLNGGYTYAGVEFVDECWCGGSINPTATKLDQQSCSVLACSGNQRQYCGKSQGMIIYRRGP